MAVFVPDEIWRQIFSHFEVVLRRDYRDLEPLKTLTALSFVSRRFHHLTESMLYRTMLLWGSNYSYHGDYHDLHVRLATALASNPHLGLSTREISLAHGNLSIEDDVMDILGERIASLNKSSGFIDRLKRDIIFGRKGSGVASFLLALMPHVRLVELYYYKEPSITLRELLGGRICQNRGEPLDADDHPQTVANHLHNLEELRITAAQGQTCVYIHYFESVLLHPNLRTLKLSGFDWMEDRIMDMEWPDYPYNLRQLNLDKCIVDTSTMRDVFSRCKKLEIFTITAGSYDMSDSLYRYWQMNLYEFGDTIRELGHKLVKFELDTSTYRYNRDAVGKIGSLHSLKALKHLSIARNDFIGHENDPEAIPLAEALPTSIEVMDFKEDVTDSELGREEYQYKKMHDELFDLVVGGQFPSLREIRLVRVGVPEKHGFEREVPGWDIEETGCLMASSTFEYIPYSDMELCMKRRGDSSGGV